MNHDKLNFWLILFLFPFVYFGLAAFSSYYHIFALGHYEPKDGQWGSFQIYLWIDGFAACVAFMRYLIGLGLLKTAARQLPRPTLALITTTSAFLSGVVLIAIIIIEPDIAWGLIWLGGLCLIPALLGVSLVKMRQSGLASHQSIPR